MTRLHPFEHAFGDLVATGFIEIREEALAARRDLKDRAHFVSTPGVQRLLNELESPDLLDAHPEAAGEYVTSLYVAFRFWDAGRHTVRPSRAYLEAAMASTVDRDRPRVPYGACYVQLPERWIWAQIDPDGPHEPLDGIFVVEDAMGRDLSILAVLGLREDRPGFSQVAIAAVPDDLRAAAAEHPDFTPTLKGGDEAGLRSVTTAAGLLHLAALALHDPSAAPA